MKRLTHLVLALLLCLPYIAISADGVNFTGLRTSSSARIVNAFIDQQYATLFGNQPFSEEEEQVLFDTDTAIAQTSLRRDRIADAIEQYERASGLARQEKLSLARTLKQIDTAIIEHQEALIQSQNSSQVASLDIRKTQERIAETQASISANTQTLMNYLEYTYARGTSIYDSGEIDLMKALILESGSMGDTLRSIQWSTIVSQATHKFLQERKELIETLNREKLALKIKKRDLRALQGRLIVAKESLEENKKAKLELLNITQWQEQRFASYLESRRESKTKLDARIGYMAARYGEVLDGVKARSACLRSAFGSEESTGQQACEHIEQTYQAERSLRDLITLDIGQSEAKVLWPVESRRITAFWRESDYYQAIGADHEAIDIAVPQGSDIVSILPWYVLYSLPPTPSGYSYLAIKHPSGLVSVYGHLSEILVQPFEIVRAGQIIAKSGGAKWIAGSGPLTSWAHLHFELFAQRKNVDPLRYFDLSELDFEGLPRRYHFKFFQDYRASYGTGIDLESFNAFILRGKSEEERQQYLLTTYASSAFNNLSLWQQEAQRSRLDTSFLICVGLSETSLGNSLKTPFNIGNVGNTDSGDTQSFESAASGIFWMGETFNNRYLGGYRSIDQLSRWGNRDPFSPIYASSASNWHNNIVSCLSALKWRFIEDDFAFRSMPKAIGSVSIVN